MRRLVAGAALALLLGACGNSDASPEAVRGSAGQEPTATSPAAPTTAAPAGGPATTAAGGAGAGGAARPTTTVRRAPATTAPPPAGPRALAPAAAGTYRFDTAGATTFAGTVVPFPAVTTLVVDPPAGTTQRSTRNLRDGAGTGVQTEFTLDYRPEGIFLVSLRLTAGFSGFTDVRELRPASPVLLLATGAGPGARREADLTGTSSARLLTEVLREERLVIGGQPVDTLVLKATVTLAPGDVTGRQELTVNVDRASRLWVKEQSVLDASAVGGLVTVRSQYTATMQRLNP
jgi:hypothetical protein